MQQEPLECSGLAIRAHLRRDGGVPTLNASTPGSWRARMLNTQLTTLMAEAGVLEGQVLASQQIHPPG